jgi:hypothetical protein
MGDSRENLVTESKQKALNGSNLSIFTARIHRETPLSIDFGIKKGRQDCKVGTVVEEYL